MLEIGKKRSLIKYAAFAFLFVLLAFLFVFFNSGSNTQEIEKVNVTDCMGRNVAVPEEVDRVVSLNADATRILVSLGSGDKIVGVDSYSLKCPILKQAYPQLQNITDVGSDISGTLSMETLASLKPDVIFVGGSSKELAEKIQNELGIPCVCSYFYVKKVSDFLCAYEVIGNVMGQQERSQHIQGYIQSKIEGITNLSKDIPEEERPKVIMVGAALGNDPFKVATVSSAIDWAGGVNLGADTYKGGGPSKTVSIEQIAQWDPDMILVNGLSLIDITVIQNDPNWMQLRAVKEGKVYRIYQGMVGYDPAIFMVQPLNLAKIMHPDKYTFDFNTEADQVFEEIYGVRGLHSIFKAEFGISEV
ncbi:MAG: ABC transporter substrate-binding protein [Euryarchaeota archaeon]|nr:ABC transporter substrate-binding protein [Euryarchaeota archaeon]